MKDLLLSEQTQKRAALFIKKPSHALIISGPAGSGKLTLAAAITEEILELAPGKLADHPYVMNIRPDEGKNSVSIEAVRRIDHFFSLKVPVRTRYNRAVIIESADSLTREAQNALLKILEEPPEHSFIILASAGSQPLLPTIRSRAQLIEVTKPSAAEIDSWFSGQGFDANSIKQAYAISGGLPGLMAALLADNDHPLKQATERARQLLSQSSYERLLAADELSKNKQLAADTVFILQQMAHVSLQSARGKAALKWQNVLEAAYETGEALAQSAQPKLAVTNLLLNL
jgi:DNA polymerase-3 subunit delta'